MQNNPPSSKPDDYRDGSKYEIFRPVYPAKFIEKTRQAPKHQNNYLDIGTGTGQVLFQVYNCFNEITVGADISESQLGAAKQKAEGLKGSLRPGQEFRFVAGDGNKIDELLKEQGIDRKFDLITIGEAFHWFEMEKLLQTLKNNLLEKEGVLAILSYAASELELNSSDEALKKQVSQAYMNFHDAVAVYKRCDLEAVYSGYAGVPFEKYFKIEKDTERGKVPSGVEGVVGHLETWSMYNFYVKARSQEAGYKDPLQTLREFLERAVKEAEANGTLLAKNNHFFTIFPYQLTLAYNNA